MSALTLGLLVAAGAAPAAAVPDPGPVNLAPDTGNGKKDAGSSGQGNQGNPPGQGNDGNQGNPDPGGNTQGNNDPGTNDAGHANGGTGANPGGGGDPGLTLGSATRFELHLTTSGDVPPDVDLSGAEFSFVAATTAVPTGTCTTDAEGSCTVHWGVAAHTGDQSVVVLPYGAYDVTQTKAPSGLAPADGGIGRFAFCVVLCDEVGAIPVTNASLFRTQVLATVLDDAGDPIPAREFSLTGQDYAAGAATSDADGNLSFAGWFAPGSWTFTPTTPVGFETLPAQERTLTTTPAQVADPWAVSLQGDVLVPLPTEVTEEQGTDGTEGTGGTGGGTADGDTGGTGTTGGDDGSDPGSGGDPGAGDPGTNDPGAGGPGGGDTDVVDSGTDDPEVPGSDDHGTGNPGTGHPGTGNPGTGHPGTDGSGTGGSGTTGWSTDTQDGTTVPVDEEPTEKAAAPTTSPGSATPARRPADAGAPIVLAEAPQLETVSFREAGLVSSGFVLVAVVVLGFFLYRRRSRRQG